MAPCRCSLNAVSNEQVQLNSVTSFSARLHVPTDVGGAHGRVYHAAQIDCILVDPNQFPCR